MQIGMAVCGAFVCCVVQPLCVCVGGGIWQSSRTLVGHEPHQPTTTWWCCEVVSFYHCPSFHIAPSVCLCVGRDKSGDSDHGGAITLHCHQQHKDHLHVVHLATHSLVCLLGCLAAHVIQEGVCVAWCVAWQPLALQHHIWHTHTSETVIGGTPNWWLC